MHAAAYRRAVTRDEEDFFARAIRLLDDCGVRHCLIGGQAVNAYVEPVVSLDVDIAIAGVGDEDTARLVAILSPHFRVERHAHSLNVTAAGSDVRVQFQLDPRYACFVDRGVRRTVLGVDVSVAAVEDVLQGKVWAALDPTRRASKRQKDLADIARLIDTFPALRAQVPAAVTDRLL